MSKQRAFVRYTKSGKIVPGSLIFTKGSYPTNGIYKEVSTDLCCDVQPYGYFDVTSSNWGFTDVAGFRTFLNHRGQYPKDIKDFSLVDGRLTCYIQPKYGEIYLDLSSQNITNVKSIDGVINVEHITLGANILTGFNPDKLPSTLKRLDLTANFPLGTFDPQNLPDSIEQLYINSCNLTSFNPTKPLPSNLKYLDLRGNSFTFNPTLPLPEGLLILDLRGTVTSFNPSLPLPSTLKELYIGNNYSFTGNFNPSVALPASLEILDISYTSLSTFNPTLPLPNGLKTLNLNSVFMLSFNPTLPLPPNLNFLDIISWNIFNPTLPLPSTLTQLAIYTSNFNPSIPLPSGLVSLNISGNFSTFNPSLALPSSLSVLAVRGNLSSFNPSIPLPNSLGFIDLRQNVLTTAGYIASLPWANAMTTIPSRGYIDFRLNTNSISGTLLESTLISKGWTILA